MHQPHNVLWRRLNFNGFVLRVRRVDVPHGALGRREDKFALNALSGRAQHNIVRGYVTIDGAEPSSSVVQLTPQEDTLLAGLTVEQTFRYASLLYSDRDDAIERADALVDALGLKARRHLVVGSALAPGGLSGGKENVSRLASTCSRRRCYAH